MDDVFARVAKQVRDEAFVSRSRLLRLLAVALGDDDEARARLPELAARLVQWRAWRDRPGEAGALEEDRVDRSGGYRGVSGFEWSVARRRVAPLLGAQVAGLSVVGALFVLAIALWVPSLLAWAVLATLLTLPLLAVALGAGARASRDVLVTGTRTSVRPRGRRPIEASRVDHVDLSRASPRDERCGVVLRLRDGAEVPLVDPLPTEVAIAVLRSVEEQLGLVPTRKTAAPGAAAARVVLELEPDEEPVEDEVATRGARPARHRHRQ